MHGFHIGEIGAAARDALRVAGVCALPAIHFYARHIQQHDGIGVAVDDDLGGQIAQRVGVIVGNGRRNTGGANYGAEGLQALILVAYHAFGYNLAGIQQLVRNAFFQ